MKKSIKITVDKLKNINIHEKYIDLFYHRYSKTEQTEGIDLIILLKDLEKENNLFWANRLLPRLFKDVKNCVRYALYTKKWTLSIWEKHYPGNDGPHVAYETAQNLLDNSCGETPCCVSSTCVYDDVAALAAGAANHALGAATYASTNHYDATKRASRAANSAANSVNCAARAVGNTNKIYKEIIAYGLELLESEQIEQIEQIEKTL